MLLAPVVEVREFGTIGGCIDASNGGARRSARALLIRRSADGAFRHRVGQAADVSSKIARWSLLTCTFVLVLGLGELILRALPGKGQGGDPGLRRLHRPEPDRPWLYGLRPGARTTLAISGDVVYEINADGFRGPRVPPARDADALRILVLGDSLAFGYGVAEEESFARRLEKLLDAERPTEVLNLGVCGYSPWNEAALLDGLGIRFRPDIVLVQFCINDLNDPTLHFDTQTRGALGEIPLSAFPEGSRVVARNPCGSWEICRRLRALLGREDPREALLSMAPLDLGPGARRDWLGGLYARMERTATGHGARIAVVGFPFRAQVMQAQMHGLQEQLGDLVSRQGVGWIDLLPAFLRASDRGDDALFIDLYHPSARGHAVAASAIAEALREAGWLETRNSSGSVAPAARPGQSTPASP